MRLTIEIVRPALLTIIATVPVDYMPSLLAAGKPFSTYLKIQDAVSVARTRFHYFDKYLDTDFFPLYLRSLDRSLDICLVTSQGNQRHGVANVLQVAQRAATEFSNFRLIQCSRKKMHDRNLRIDDRIFHLGPSVSDAGTKPKNFTVAESTPQAHNVLDDLILKGKVVA